MQRILLSIAAAVVALLAVLGIASLVGSKTQAPLVDAASQVKSVKNLNWQPIGTGSFAPTTRAAVVVREVDTKGNIAYYHPQWVEVGQALNIGKGVDNNAVLTRDAWSADGASIEAAYAETLALARADLNDFKQSFIQIECPSNLAAAKSAGYQESPYAPSFILITSAKQGDESWMTTECTSAPSDTPMPAAQDTPVPAATAAVNCGNVSAVAPGTIVPKGTLVVYEVVDYSRGTVTVVAGVLSADTKAGAQKATPMVHINMWTGYCGQVQADQAAAGELDERTMESQTPGNWAQGYTVSKGQMP